MSTRSVCQWVAEHDDQFPFQLRGRLGGAPQLCPRESPPLPLTNHHRGNMAPRSPFDALYCTAVSPTKPLHLKCIVSYSLFHPDYYGPASAQPMQHINVRLSRFSHTWSLRVELMATPSRALLRRRPPNPQRTKWQGRSHQAYRWMVPSRLSGYPRLGSALENHGNTHSTKVPVHRREYISGKSSRWSAKLFEQVSKVRLL